MADLYQVTQKPMSLYKDRRYAGDVEERERQLRRSTTLYVGNLSFYTNEEQVFELFSKAGEIRRIIMGLDRIKKTPCGFCFVEYFTRDAAENSVRFISGSKLDERVIRVDYDTGFEPGRQFGRGRSGGQVRDEYRQDYDPGRGGYGKAGEQSGMTGMQMWGASDPGPPGNGGRFFGGDRGRPWGRGGGRGRRGRGRGGGYGPPPQRQGGFYDDGRGFDGRPPKRRRDFDPRFDDGPREMRRGKMPRVDEFGPGMNGGPRFGDDGPRRDGPPQQGQGPGPDDAPPTRNARFERGKDEEE